MSSHEQDLHHDDNQHTNPALIEWALPEEGLDICLKLDVPGVEKLPPLCREQMARLLGKVALLCETTVANQDALKQNGVALEGVFVYLAEYTAGLIPLMQMLAGADHQVPEDFPFQI